MNRHEKIALENTKRAFNWNVGGWMNAISDYDEEDYKECIPCTLEYAKAVIYDEAMNNTFGVGSVWFTPIKEMRFAGSDFVRCVIDYLFMTDEDIKEIAKVMNW